MHKFDVKYTLKNYYEYYKHTLFSSKIYTDLIFTAIFVGLSIYIWVDTSEKTEGNALAILSLVMGLLFPLMNFVTLGLVKKQLNNRASVIANTHIIVTFNDEDVLYENLTPEAINEKPEVKQEEKDVQVVDNTETPEEESLEGSINKDVTTSIKVDELKEEESKDERSFRLQYGNFMKVKEIKGLFLFYLDKRTVIILPKETYLLDESNTLESFRSFILSKVNPKRCKLMKN